MTHFPPQQRSEYLHDEKHLIPTYMAFSIATARNEARKVQGSFTDSANFLFICFFPDTDGDCVWDVRKTKCPRPRGSDENHDVRCTIDIYLDSQTFPVGCISIDCLYNETLGLQRKVLKGQSIDISVPLGPEQMF